jgi:hypothetical protein
MIDDLIIDSDIANGIIDSMCEHRLIDSIIDPMIQE